MMIDVHAVHIQNIQTKTGRIIHTDRFDPVLLFVRSTQLNAPHLTSLSHSTRFSSLVFSPVLRDPQSLAVDRVDEVEVRNDEHCKLQLQPLLASGSHPSHWSTSIILHFVRRTPTSFPASLMITSSSFVQFGILRLLPIPLLTSLRGSKTSRLCSLVRGVESASEVCCQMPLVSRSGERAGSAVFRYDVVSGAFENLGAVCWFFVSVRSFFVPSHPRTDSDRA